MDHDFVFRRCSHCGIFMDVDLLWKFCPFCGRKAKWVKVF